MSTKTSNMGYMATHPYRPSSLNRSLFLPSSRLATKNHKLLIQHNTTPTQVCAGPLKRLIATSWNALLGTATNVAVNGEVALTRSKVPEKTAHEPMPPNSIMAQKKGTSRKGMLWYTCGTSPEMMTMGVKIMSDTSDV